MKNISELKLGFDDAENYLLRQNKEFFNYVFVRNRYLDQLLEPNRYFLIGEKGTGKTAYSAFLANNNGYGNSIANLRFVRETEYAQFIRLKRNNELFLSDYVDIWIVILLLLFANSIGEEEMCDNVFSRPLKIRALRAACDEFYNKAFSPEISQAIRFVEDVQSSVKLVGRHIQAQVGECAKQTAEASRFQTQLLYLRKVFVEALGQLKLKSNHLLLIDGIDVRPGDIPYCDYLDCVKGLANAIWRLNNDVFPAFRDSKGRFRVVLLSRPDIFNSLCLQNAANKIRDNAVYLDWNTKYADCENSDLFKLTDKLLSWRQDSQFSICGDAWRHYFPWRMSEINHDESWNDSSFVYFLKLSYCRPRDFVSVISCLRDVAVRKGFSGEESFASALAMDSDFKETYSELLLMGIKDQLSFYYTEREYQLFRNFFMYLKGRCEFDYEYFNKAFLTYKKNIMSEGGAEPQFVDTPDRFLQFLYDMNVLSYKEVTDRGAFFRWCYRERAISNLSPQVEIGGQYVVHYGLRKALNLGRANRIDKSGYVL